MEVYNGTAFPKSARVHKMNRGENKHRMCIYADTLYIQSLQEPMNGSTESETEAQKV